MTNITSTKRVQTDKRPVGHQIWMIMRLTTVLIIISTLSTSARSYSQAVSLSLEAVPVESALRQIRQQTGCSFLWNEQTLKGLPLVSVSVHNASLTDAVKACLKGLPLTYKIHGKVVYIERQPALPTSINSAPPQHEVTGQVRDSATGKPLAGVTVKVKGGSAGTVTDSQGKFDLQVPDNAVLEVSYLGYTSLAVPTAGKTMVNVSLAATATGLNQLIVVGYGTQKKGDLTGSVSTISSEQYQEQPVSRLDQVLQGRAAGVDVSNGSGAPGGDVRIRIRGSNSILGNNNPLYVVDGFVGADFSTINPDDIASIQILKDASSTAIYGSRGANGVVIITTKKGKTGKMRIRYSGKVSTSQVLRKFDMLPAGEFAQLVNQRNEILGLNPAFTDDEINQFKQEGGTDWQDLVFRNAIGQEHELSVSGGGEKTTYFVSGSYLNKEGIINASKYKRYSLQSNISTQISQKLTFDLNVSVNNQNNTNTQLQSGTSNPVVQALTWAPTTPAYNPDGSFVVSDPVGSVMFSPVALMYDRDNIVNRTAENIIGHLNYQLIDGLNLDVRYAVDHVNQRNKTFNGSSVTKNNPNAAQNATEAMTLQGTHSVSYKKTFEGGHTLDAVAVFEIQSYKDNAFNATATGLLIPDLKYDNLKLSGSPDISSGLNNWSLLSLLGRVNYTYKNKYLFTASFRRDGSSKFQRINRFSNFPALAIGWNLSQENFIKDLDLFSNLKIRASWGKTGSQAVQPFATQSTYGTIIYAFNNNDLTSGLLLGNPGNPNLKWETTDQKDIGLEVGLFEGRLNVEADYFSKHTSDLLLNRPLPSYVGGGVLTSNAGKVNNKGFEVSVNAQIIDRPNFSWNSHFNFSNVQNEVVSLGGITDKFFTGSRVGAGLSTQSEFVVLPGYALGEYWGLKYLGTWKPGEKEAAAQFGAEPGDSRYEDINGDNKINADDYQPIGNGMPKTTMGWNNTLTYKALTLNLFFQSMMGFDKINYSYAGTMVGGGDSRQFTMAKIRDRYIPGENETSNIPAFSKTNVTYPMSTMFMEEGDFIRLKNVSLSYNIPVKLLQNDANIKVYVAGYNLWTITNYTGIDPESSNAGSGTDINQSIDYGSYPNSKSFILGVKIDF